MSQEENLTPISPDLKKLETETRQPLELFQILILMLPKYIEKTGGLCGCITRLLEIDVISSLEAEVLNSAIAITFLAQNVDRDPADDLIWGFGLPEPRIKWLKERIYEFQIRDYIKQFGEAISIQINFEGTELYVSVYKMKINAKQTFQILNEIQDITKDQFPFMGRKRTDNSFIDIIFKSNK